MRIESDVIGSLEISENAYWGIHTQRAIKNFAITGAKVSPCLIKALAFVKKACCIANEETGFLSSDKSKYIISACDEIAEGSFIEHFPIDYLQGGAGTSMNMNINEVIANRAIELCGECKGNYKIIHPIEDVNLHQSTNDVYPTAIKIAAIFGIRELSKSIALLQGVFQEKEKEYAHIVKIGRTEFQEAVPITLGAEFSAFAEAFSRDRWRTFKCEERLRVVNIGGTAVGTGLTAPREYIFRVIEKLREVTQLGLARGDNIMGETANADPFVEVSGILRTHAINIIKISNDLRLMNFLGEIHLPKLQAGSSVMPGKINPVLLESAVQVGLKVMSNDFLVSEVANRGTWQINEFLPLLSHALLESLEILKNIDMLLCEHIKNLSADEVICRTFFEKSPMIITAFLPVIGYDKATELIQSFYLSGENNMKDFLGKQIGQKLVEEVLSPYRLTSLGYKKYEQNS